MDTHSIRAFAQHFQAQHDRLDILINNAGSVIAGMTPQGIDQVFMADFLGHYMLTELLYDTLAKTKGARVINVSSQLHRYYFVHLSLY